MVVAVVVVVDFDCGVVGDASNGSAAAAAAATISSFSSNEDTIQSAAKGEDILGGSRFDRCRRVMVMRGVSRVLGGDNLRSACTNRSLLLPDDGDSDSILNGANADADVNVNANTYAYTNTNTVVAP